PPANDMFCPSDPVKRAQMATFMRRLAENQVVDAGWLQGKTAADFAASNQACAGGQAVSGFDASGNANCTSFGLTGYFSCAGTTFTPYESTVDYSSSSSLRYRTSVTGNGRFRCNVAIPNGATVTGVDFSIKDSSGTDSVSNCEMWRTNLTTSIGVETQMANAGGTTAGDTAGSRVISDTTISSATVDNDNYAYFLQCAINGTTTATGIWGADVSYSATALGTVDDPTDQPTGDSAG
ncbi:MAG: hypothetical protein ACE5E8_06915, partial [Acidimicrobiia bacterium]